MPDTSPPSTTFPLIARASNTVRNKNLLIILMCAAFMVWFGYDGWVGWPQRNDLIVRGPMTTMLQDGKIRGTEQLPIEQIETAIKGWPGWNAADHLTRLQMTAIAQRAATTGTIEGWHAETDIANQHYIVFGLAAATLAAIGWFFHCQRRRAIAEEGTVSPSPGVVVPWEKITQVDNTRWKASGIVEITYTTPEGSQKAKFDDYELDREPLLLILDQLAEKAVNAEFIPKEDVAETPAASA